MVASGEAGERSTGAAYSSPRPSLALGVSGVVGRRAAQLDAARPALTTRIAVVAQPWPDHSIVYLGHVLAGPRVPGVPLRARRPSLAVDDGVPAEPGHAVDGVDDEVEAVDVVAHDHVERRRDGALSL